MITDEKYQSEIHKIANLNIPSLLLSGITPFEK